jgi:hypothetical protein
VARYIGLSGYARSGKDTVAGFLIEQGWTRFAFADKLKLAVKKLNPILDCELGMPFTLDQALTRHGAEKTKELYKEYRRLLQVMGTEVGREMFGDNFWVEQALREVQENDLAVFTDCRFPNEAQAIKDRGGEVWRINRPGYGPVNGHASEISLDDWAFDHIIDNDRDLDALRYKVSLAVALRSDLESMA